MLTGSPPFDESNRNLLFEKIKKGQFQMPRNIDPNLEDLLR